MYGRRIRERKKRFRGELRERRPCGRTRNSRRSDVGGEHACTGERRERDDVRARRGDEPVDVVTAVAVVRAGKTRGYWCPGVAWCVVGGAGVASASRLAGSGRRARARYAVSAAGGRGAARSAAEAGSGGGGGGGGGSGSGSGSSGSSSPRRRPAVVVVW